MPSPRYYKKIIFFGCIIALGICLYNPVTSMPAEEIASFFEPRIQFLKSVRFTIIDHSLDLVLDWIKSIG